MRKILLFIYRPLHKIFGGTFIGRLYPIKFVMRYFVPLVRTNKTQVDGHIMYLDKYDSLKLSLNGIYEEDETRLIKKTVKKGDVVIDIGANIGYYTLIMARNVGKKGKVYAFEPDPENFSLLKKNIKKNGYQNAVLVQKAVSDKNGEISLFLSDSNTGDHRIVDTKDGRNSVKVEMISIDDFLNDVKINFIKMDIQGAEYFALKGMKETLKKSNNVKMFTEFWPSGLREFGIRPGKYIDLLTEYGFNLFELKKGDSTPSSVEKEELLRRYSVKNKKFTDLFCTKD